MVSRITNQKFSAKESQRIFSTPRYYFDDVLIRFFSLVINFLPNPEVRWASTTTMQYLMKFILSGSRHWFWCLFLMIWASNPNDWSDPIDLMNLKQDVPFYSGQWIKMIHDSTTAIFVLVVISWRCANTLFSHSRRLCASMDEWVTTYEEIMRKNYFLIFDVTWQFRFSMSDSKVKFKITA